MRQQKAPQQTGKKKMKRLTDFIGDMLFAMCAIALIALVGWTWITLTVEFVG